MIAIDLLNMEESLLLVEKSIEACAGHLDPKQHYKANFVSEEILSNLARHGHFENRVPDVSLNLDTQDSKTLLLTFKDNANFFNLLTHPDPKIGGKLEDASLGGLGIYLTKQYAEQIEHAYEDNYNIVTIVL